MQKALVAPIGGEHKTHCTLAGPGKTCSVTEIKKDWLLLFVSVLAEGDKLVFWEHLNTKSYYVDVKFSCGPGNLHRKLYLSVQHLKKSTNQTRPSSFILLQHFKPLPKKPCWKGKNIALDCTAEKVLPDYWSHRDFPANNFALRAAPDFLFALSLRRDWGDPFFPPTLALVRCLEE